MGAEGPRRARYQTDESLKVSAIEEREIGHLHGLDLPASVRSLTLKHSQFSDHVDRLGYVAWFQGEVNSNCGVDQNVDALSCGAPEALALGLHGVPSRRQIREHVIATVIRHRR